MSGYRIEIFGREVPAEFEISAFGELKRALDLSERVGIACSGGADSVFLLLSLMEKLKPDRLCVLHFNHKARAAADVDEDFVRSLAENFSLEFISGRPDSVPEKLSEDEFRRMRMDFFRREFFKKNLSLIAQGHHAGDVAETMLMRLSRGSGIDGLCAPRPVSEVGGVRFVRPLLKLKKTFITSVLEGLEQGWREDESNAKPQFLRNKIRLNVIGTLEDISASSFVSSAVRSRELLQEDADFIGRVFRSELSRLNPGFSENPPSSLYLSGRVLAERALLRRAVLFLLSSNGLLSGMRSGAVEDFLRRLESSKGKIASASAGGGFICFNPRDNSLSLLKGDCRVPFEILLEMGKNILPGGILTLKSISLSGEMLAEIKSGKNDDNIRAFLDPCAARSARGDLCLVARSPRDGDSYAPLGSASPKRLGEIFNGKKIPRVKRKAFPVVCNTSGEILWVPSLPPADKYKLVNGSEAIELTYEAF